VIARTDADAADLITSDCDPYDREFVTGERTSEGFFRTHAGIEQAISRGLAYAPYADLVWCETSKPDLEQARRFAEAIHARFPGKLLAYNCSPSFNWKKNLDDKTIAHFQQRCLIWVTNTSSSRWRGSTACGSTCSTWPMPMRRVKA
jgi:isocitrate lyase